MSDFQLFDQLFSSMSISENNLKGSDACTHSNTTDNSGIIVCTDCGEEIEKTVLHDKEWRYYGQSDTKYASDPNRCQPRKIDEKNIFKDVEGLGFNDKVLDIANKIYVQVTGGKIHRGKSRKAIIFACVFYTFKRLKNPLACESLIEIFNLDRKTGLRGLKHVNLNISKEEHVNDTVHITPVNLIEDIMNKFSATPEQKLEVINLYSQIHNKSSKINRSRPRSVAAGLIYYWMELNNKNILLKDFIQFVKLSELTVDRLAKEIKDILSQDKLIYKLI